MTTKRVVVVEGDDASPEAMRPAVALIDQLDVPIEWDRPLVGQAAVDAGEEPFPEATRAAIDASDTTFFGATSGMSVQALFYLRWGKGTYANVRPARWYPGCRSPYADPAGIDFVIVRENLEDMYMGIEGDLGDLDALQLRSPFANRAIADMKPGRYALKVITEEGTERVVRFAFELARRRREQGHPGKVTSATKHNMLWRSDGYFREIAARVAEAYSDIEYENYIVDDFARRLVAEPHALDVVVMPNLYGDILSDAAAGVIGGLGLAPSGCYGDDYAYFESAHGSAPDIAGRNIINPTASILSAAMMLEYLGFQDAAAQLPRAVERVYADGNTLTPDQGGTASTTEFCDAVAAYL